MINLHAPYNWIISQKCTLLSLSPLSIHFPFADCIGQGCLFVRFSICWREMGWFLGANCWVLQGSGTPWHFKICTIQRLSTCNFVELRDISTFQILYFVLFPSASISYPTKPIDMVTLFFFFNCQNSAQNAYKRKRAESEKTLSSKRVIHTRGKILDNHSRDLPTTKLPTTERTSIKTQRSGALRWVKETTVFGLSIWIWEGNPDSRG